MARMSGGVQTICIQNIYCATLQVLLGVGRIWSLLCLCKHLPSPAAATNHFFFAALEFFRSWSGYIVHSTLTGCVVGHEVRALHSWAYYFWMSPEWTTASRLTLRDQKEFQFSLAVWGYHHWGRWRRTLFVARWGGRYAEVTHTQPSGIHYEVPAEEGTLHTAE